MATPLEGRAYVVTGSGRGIGSEVAKLIGSLGGNVVVNDPGVNLDGSGSDAGPAAEIAKAINDQGIGKAVANVVAVHLTGFFNVVKPASIIMRQQRSGRIVGFSSGSGMNGNTGQANYGAAKAGITGGVRCAARDLGRYGITANAICPGAATRMTQSVPDASRDLRARAGIGGGAPRGESIVNQLRDAKYVAPMVTYLMTDQAWTINGKCFYVSGGNVSLAHEETPYRTIAKAGTWEIDELRALVPSQLMQGTSNPAPPPADLDLPARPVAKAE